MNPRTALSIYLCVTCPLISRIKLNGTLQYILMETCATLCNMNTKGLLLKVIIKINNLYIFIVK